VLDSPRVAFLAHALKCHERTLTTRIILSARLFATSLTLDPIYTFTLSRVRTTPSRWWYIA